MTTEPQLARVDADLNAIMAWLRREHERRVAGCPDRPATATAMSKLHAELKAHGDACRRMASIMDDPRWGSEEEEDDDDDPARDQFLTELCREELKFTLPFPDCMLVVSDDKEHVRELDAGRVFSRYMPKCPFRWHGTFWSYAFVADPDPSLDGKCFNMRDQEIERLCDILDRDTKIITNALLDKLFECV